MDKKKSVLNVCVSMAFKLITMALVIVVKRILIRTCGNEINGLNALYLSIVGFLTVAELGVGSAITFCMYRPIVMGEERTVAALYSLFRRLYSIIGGVILAVGLAIAPFIRIFAADYNHVDVNLQISFVLMLVSVVVTYFYGAQLSLLNAYKNNYIATTITSGGVVLQYLLQITTLLLTQSFYWYLVCRTMSTIVQFVAVEIITHRKYYGIICRRETLELQTKRELTKTIKAMFLHKVGYLLIATADSIIISVFLGVFELGLYSNYSTIQVSISSLLKLLFSSLSSVLGHLYVEKNKEATQKYCERLQLLNFFVGVVFFLGYYSIIDNLIAILFAADLVADKTVSMVVTLNGFVQFMRTNIITFRDATGTFYHDRWKPVVEGLVNVVLSVLLVKWIGVVGVIVATIITNLTICHVIEPYVLYKYAFNSTPKKFYLKNYGMICVFFCAVMVMEKYMMQLENQWAELLLNGCISVGISAVVCGGIFAGGKFLRIIGQKREMN